jgi:hypothetical protein
MKTHNQAKRPQVKINSAYLEGLSTNAPGPALDPELAEHAGGFTPKQMRELAGIYRRWLIELEICADWMDRASLWVN